MASIKANCRKVICIGRNYADHITELSSARPSQPFFFLKPTTSILEPDSGPILRPQGVSLHYETELGVVVGNNNKKPRKNLPDHPSTMSFVHSYFMALDMTARNVQNEAKKKGLPWTIAKGFDTFCPVGPVIPKTALPEDPHSENVVLHLQVNGETRQKDGTSLMLFRIPRLIADVSRVMTLEDGDVILTGTPKGVGEVVPGDTMRVSLEVGGEEVAGAGFEVRVEDAPAGQEAYEYRET